MSTDPGIIVDVREPEEFMTERIPGSVNVPLSTWDRCAPKLASSLGSHQVMFTCLSGARAKMAAEKWKDWMDEEAPAPAVCEGGLKGWKERGGETEGSGRSTNLNLFRQVQLVVGPLVMISALAALLGNPLWAIPAAILGFGLSFAGLTGFCGLAVLLSRAPWNRPKSNRQASCNVEVRS